MDLAYAAFTEACVFGLDEAGICREILPKPGASRDMLTLAMRCVGAQYVASLDGSVEGFLTQVPTKGTRLLFARTEEGGRIVLVRSGPIQRFETLFGDDLAASSELATDRYPSVDQVSRFPQVPQRDESAPRSIGTGETPSTRPIEDPTERFARTRRPSQGGLEVAALSDAARSPRDSRTFN